MHYKARKVRYLIKFIFKKKIYYIFSVCGSSSDSYNLSTDSSALNPLRYNSPSPFNASNTSFNTTTNTSLLDPTTYGANTTINFNHALQQWVAHWQLQIMDNHHQHHHTLKVLLIYNRYQYLEIIHQMDQTIVQH